MDPSFLVFLLFLALVSLQIHARESQFFSKTSSSELPPTVSASSIAEEPPMVLPPRSHNGYGLYGRDHNYDTNTDNAAYREGNYPNNIPSSVNNKQFYGDNIPSSFTAAEYTTANNYIPSTYSDEEFNRGSNTAKLPSYSNYDKKQYGMSDTRFLENGKYFYDANAERNSREYEPMKGNPERYGSYEYVNEEGRYLNNQEKKEMQDDYVP